eukprot:TRINITY_DN1658_c0_g1_i20.p2 TRINITY_DN1658_c0_g1~~TRINITY_DN1658_c0_g1_i20.p2  ORF type:complete len:288 (-),score=83.78 TRINITY_DN1658_c0_g1_i20:47-910(-)
MAELKTTKEESNRLKAMLDELLSEQVGNVANKKKRMEEVKLILENKELTKDLQRQEQELERLREISRRQQSKKRLRQGSAGKRKEEKSGASSTLEKSHIEKELKQIKENLNKRMLIHTVDGGEIERLKHARAIKVEVPIVAAEEGREAIEELRLALIGAGVSKERIQTVLFYAFGSDDRISVHELERALTRKPLLLSKDLANKIARYLIEPSNKATVEYSELAEKDFSTVIERLEALIETYKLYDTPTESLIKESLSTKLKGKHNVISQLLVPVSYTHLTLPTTPYV